MHPHTGEYVDAEETIIKPIYSRAKLTRNKTQNGQSHPNSASTIQLPSLAPQGSNQSKLHEKIPLCYKCHESDIALSSHSVSLSNSDTSVKSKLLKCDYCDAFWHLDCLDPPLACPPVSSKEEEMVDMNYVQGVVKRLNGDPTLIRGHGGVSGFSLRQRWKCPLHCQDEVDRKRVRISNDSETETYYDELDGYMISESTIKKRFIDRSKVEKLKECARWESTIPAGVGLKVKSNIKELYSDKINEAIKDLPKNEPDALKTLTRAAEAIASSTNPSWALKEEQDVYDVRLSHMLYSSRLIL